MLCGKREILCLRTIVSQTQILSAKRIVFLYCIIIGAFSTFCFSLMQSIVSSVYTSDLEGPIKRLAMERQKIRNMSDEKTFGVTFSIYREILFLACKAIGRANIDLNEFDKVYTGTYYRITERNNKLYSTQDKPISINTLYCRQYFRPLCLPSIS